MAYTKNEILSGQFLVSILRNKNVQKIVENAEKPLPEYFMDKPPMINYKSSFHKFFAIPENAQSVKKQTELNLNYVDLRRAISSFVLRLTFNDFKIFLGEAILSVPMTENFKSAFPNEFQVKNILSYDREQRIALDNLLMSFWFFLTTKDDNIKGYLMSQKLYNEIAEKKYESHGEITEEINNLRFKLDVILDSYSIFKYV